LQGRVRVSPVREKRISRGPIQVTKFNIKSGFKGLHAILAFDNWPMLLLQRLFDRGAGFVVYRKRGLEILIDHHGADCNGTRACIVTDMYSRYFASFELFEPISILDLGANGGGFPLLLRIAGKRLARVVCVEMNPTIYQRLAINLTTNLGISAIPINAAVCAVPDSEILLRPSRGSTGESIYDHRPEPGQPYLSVRTTSLQALYEQYFRDEFIDICKIDIEGAEYEVFDSCPDGVLRKIRNLLIEFHDAHRTPALLERLEHLGFRELAAGENHETGSHTEVRAFRGPDPGPRSERAQRESQLTAS
jgi:FkbM family methyltransferase